ncbi:MAG: hypothetical protein CVT49_11090 [candidate division Zixibacteria bacterium HGW-Zixibacteria-1]|nr:MAG: hypothetical protein CVT49_11090 [candidate division Zixibacteria bacterium HGW-Zixibacteria-1]
MLRFSKYFVALLFLILLAASPAFSQDKGESVQIIDNSGNPVFNKPWVHLAIPTGMTDDVVFANQNTYSVELLNDKWPAGRTQKTAGGGDVLTTTAPGNSKQYIFSPEDRGRWMFLVKKQGQPTYTDTLWIYVNVPAPVSSLTPYGIIVLLILLIASAVWILTRKRVAATT